MTEQEKATTVADVMGEGAELTSVSWEDFLTVCKERDIEYVEGKTVLQMREDFLSNLDKVEPDSEEEANLSQQLVDIQVALVGGAKIIGSPEEASPKDKKKKKPKKEKVKKEPKPKKEKTPKTMKPKLGGVGMKQMCRDLFKGKTKPQVLAAEEEIKNKLADVYVNAGLGDKDYGLTRAGRIFYDIFKENFNESPKPKAAPIPKEKKKEAKTEPEEAKTEPEEAKTEPEEAKGKKTEPS